MFYGSIFATDVTFVAGTDLGSISAAANAGADQVTKEGVTISVSKGVMGLTGNNAHYRCYKNETLTVESSVGNITKIEITCTADGEALYGPGSINNVSVGTYTAGTAKIGTWTGDAASVVFTAGNAQVRPTQIVVTIGGDPVTPELKISGTTPFVGKTTVTITPTNEDYSVYYTTDGSDPENSTQLYNGPFDITESCTVKAWEEETGLTAEMAFEKQTTSEIENIAAFIALEDNAVATLKLSDAIVLGAGNKNIILKDATGSLIVYDANNTIEVTQGQKVSGTITGTKVLYGGLPELKDITDKNLTITAGTITPVTVTATELVNKDYIQ